MAVSGRAIRRAAGRLGDSGWVEGLGRYGLIAKGISFGIVGVLATMLALGVGGRAADREGAFLVLSQDPVGLVLLIALAVGFGAYASWRYAQALLNRDDEGNTVKGWGKRLGNLAKALFYTGLAVIAIGAITAPRGESASEKEWTARILDLPLGRWLVGIAGAAFFVYGLWNGYRSITGRFRKHMKTGQMQRELRPLLNVVGFLGHAARMLLFGLIGVFLMRAAYQYDAREAIGIDGALAKLANQSYGPLWLGGAAVGLIAYGVFSVLQARYRDI